MAGDVVFLDVLPKLQTFASELTKGTTAAAQSAGKGSGVAWAKSFEGAAGDAGSSAVVKELEAAAKKTKKVVDDQTAAIGKARAAQKDAAAKVVEAEQKLADARAKGDTAKIEAAELRLGAARDRSESAAKKVEQAEGALKSAHDEHKTVVGQLEDATKELDSAQSGAAKSADDQARAVESVKAGMKTAMVTVAAFATAAIAGGVALYKVGEEFDTMTDTIRVGTGAQGEALDALSASAKTVATSVPTDFAAAGTTIADLNTRLGLTGPVLETLASQVLEAGRIMGEEINVNDMTAAFNAFQVQGEDTTTAMDHLFRVSQATGIGMNELATKVASQAPAVQELGFSFEQTATMVGALDKAGLNSQAVLGAMGKSLVNLAKEGEEPQDAFRRVVGEIEGFIASGDRASAIDMAGKVFGTRGASQFIGAIESGALAMSDLDAMAAGAGDTILGAGADTMDFAEKWQMFKNDVLVQLEPVATRVFNAMGTAMDWIKTTALPVIKDIGGEIKDRLQPAFEAAGGFITGTLVPGFRDLVDWVKQNQEWLIPLAAAVGAMVLAWQGYQLVMALARGVTVAYTAVQAGLNVVMSANPIGIITLALVGLVTALVVAYQNSETFRNIVQGAWEGIKNAAGTAWEFLQGVFEKLKSGVQLAGDKFTEAKDRISGAWDTVRSALAAGWQWINDNVFAPVKVGVDAVGQAFDATQQFIATAWDKVKAAAAAPVNFIIETVYTDGIKATWDKIATAVGLTSLKLPTVSPIKFAEGGVLPGYTPGQDVHHFWSPTGGRLDLSGGEGILRPDALRALGGKAWLDTVNRSRGRRQSFAEGGEVSFWDQVGGVVSGIGSNIKDLVVDVAKVLADPVGSLKNMLSAPVEALLGQVTGGQLGQMLIEIPRSVVGGIIDKAKEMIAALVVAQSSTAGGVYQGALGGWVRPSSGPITSPYGMRNGILHNGVDFGGNLPVYAANSGLVVATGDSVGYYNTGLGVRVSHGGGLESYYGHADPGEIKVRAGQQVTAGQHISWGGNTGNSTGQHLHFSLFQNGRPINPMVFDQGGYLQPNTAGVNLSTKPEPVLTGQQWADIHQLAMAGGSDSQGGVTPDMLRRALDGATLTLLGVDYLSNATAARINTAISRSA